MFAQDIKTSKHMLENENTNNAVTKPMSRSGKLKQTTLCLDTVSKKKAKPSTGDNVEIKSNVFVLPHPPKLQYTKPILSETPSCSKNVTKPENNDEKNITLKRRNQIAIVGKVHFCLEIYRAHPKIEAIWNVYGVLCKKLNGKQRHELILLIRGENGGAVLQAIYHENNGVLNSYKRGSHIRVVGRFIGNNRLHTFRAYQLQQKISETETLARIQNVTSFALSQKGN